MVAELERERVNGGAGNRQSDRSDADDADDVVEAEANPKSIIINNGSGVGGGGGGGRSEARAVGRGGAVGRRGRWVDQVSDLNAVLRRNRQHEEGRWIPRWQPLRQRGDSLAAARPTRGQCGDHV